MKIVKYPEESGLLIKTVSEAIKNEAREQKGGILGIVLGTLSYAHYYMLTGKLEITGTGQ